MPNNDNWVKDQVIAAYNDIERDRHRQRERERQREIDIAIAAEKAALHAKTMSRKASDRIGFLVLQEFGTLDIDAIAKLERKGTDAKFNTIRTRILNEIATEKESNKKINNSIIIAGTIILIFGAALYVVNTTAAGAAGIIGAIVLFFAWIREDAGLSLLLRCKQIIETTIYDVDVKRGDAG